MDTLFENAVRRFEDGQTVNHLRPQLEYGHF